MNYLEWNLKIFNHYLTNNDGRIIVLSATIRVLKRLAPEVGDPTNDFLDAILKGPENEEPERFSFHNGIVGWRFKRPLNIIEKAYWLKQCWRDRKYFIKGENLRSLIWPEDYPPYIAYLFFLVLNVEKDDSSYWRSLNNKINSDQQVGSRDGKYIIEIFEDLRKFNKSFFFCNIYSTNVRKYVGTLYSQLPFTREEEENIVRCFKNEQISCEALASEDRWNDDAKVDFLFEIKSSLNPATVNALDDRDNLLRQVIIDYYLNNLQDICHQHWENVEEEPNDSFKSSEIALRLVLTYNSDRRYMLSLRCQSSSLDFINNQRYSNLTVGGQRIHIGSDYTTLVHSFASDALITDLRLRSNFSDIDGQVHSRSLYFFPDYYYLFEEYQQGDYAQLGSHQAILKNKEYFLLYQTMNETIESFLNGLGEYNELTTLNNHTLLKFKNPTYPIDSHRIKTDVSFGAIGDRDINFIKDNTAFLSTALPVIKVSNICLNENLIIDYGNGIPRNNFTFKSEPEAFVDLNKYSFNLQTSREISLYLQRDHNVKKKFFIKLPSIPPLIINSSLSDRFDLRYNKIDPIPGSIHTQPWGPDNYYNAAEQLLYTISNFQSLKYHRLKKFVSFFVRENDTTKGGEQYLDPSTHYIIQQLIAFNYIRVERVSNSSIVIPNPPHLVPLNVIQEDPSRKYFLLSGARTRDFLNDFFYWLNEIMGILDIKFGYSKTTDSFLPYTIFISTNRPFRFLYELRQFQSANLLQYNFTDPNSNYVPYVAHIDLPSLNKIVEIYDDPGANRYKIFNREMTSIVTRSINNQDEILLGYSGDYDKKYFVYYENMLHYFERTWAFYKYLNLAGIDNIILYDPTINLLAVPNLIGLPYDFQRFLVLASGSEPRVVFVRNSFTSGRRGRPTFFINLQDIRLDSESIASYTLYACVSQDIVKVIETKLSISFTNISLKNLI